MPRVKMTHVKDLQVTTTDPHNRRSDRLLHTPAFSLTPDHYHIFYSVKISAPSDKIKLLNIFLCCTNFFTRCVLHQQPWKKKRERLEKSISTLNNAALHVNKTTHFIIQQVTLFAQVWIFKRPLQYICLYNILLYADADDSLRFLINFLIQTCSSRKKKFEV